MNILEKEQIWEHFRFVIPMIILATWVVIKQRKIIWNTLKMWFSWGDFKSGSSERITYMKIFGVGVVAFFVSSFLGKNLRPDLEVKYQQEVGRKMIEEKLTTQEELVKKALEKQKQIDKFITEKKRLPTTMPLGNISLFLSFITVVIIAPIVEECLCRYLIFEIFGNSNIFAYIFSGSIFIFLHGAGGILNLTSLSLLLINYLPMTILFIYAYHESKKNITYPIYFHMMGNLIVFLSTTAAIYKVSS